jgi:membrane peptidoglycan carboxypeptidase
MTQLSNLILFILVNSHLSLCAYAGPLNWLAENSGYSLPPEKIHFESLIPKSSPSVYDRNHEILFSFPINKKISFYRPLSEIDPKLVKFLVLLEDAKFYQHNGLDFAEIQNSLKENIEKGKFKRGASTITQQLVKNLFLNKEKSIARKLIEIPWTKKVEADLSKKQILELYLNIIEWGPGIYGAEAASRHFFDKPCNDLDISEAMLLSLIVPNPIRFDLYAHPKYKDFLESKRSAFSKRMVHEKQISPDDLNFILDEEFNLATRDNNKRLFPLNHQGAYEDNLAKGNKGWSWLYNEIGSTFSQSKDLNLSLDKNKQKTLFSIPLQKDINNKFDRFFVEKEESKIVAVLKISKGQAPSSELPESLEEVKKINFKELAR